MSKYITSLGDTNLPLLLQLNLRLINWGVIRERWRLIPKLDQNRQDWWASLFSGFWLVH